MHVARVHRYPGWLRLTCVVVGVVLALGGAGLIWSMRHYLDRANATARALTAQFRANDKNCAAPPPSAAAPAKTARAVLTIPALGLTAPILAGTDGTALDSGVGHVDESNWPDQGGTSVLEAHNVTFFAQLPRLHPNDIITVTEPCRSWTYAVAHGTVVKAGSPLPNDPAPSLVLVTCYPTNALFLTDRRYVLTAHLIKASIAAANPPTPPGLTPVRAALPAGLNPSELSVDGVGILLGKLQLSDPTAPTGSESVGGFQAAQEATRLLVAAERAATSNRRDWWSVVAPDVAYKEASVLAGPARWQSQINVIITASGGMVTGGTLTGTVATRSGPETVTVTVAVSNAVMSIVQISYTRAPSPVRPSPATPLSPRRPAVPSRSARPSVTSSASVGPSASPFQSQPAIPPSAAG